MTPYLDEGLAILDRYGRCVLLLLALVTCIELLTR